MLKQKWIALLLGLALIVPGAASAAPWDFSAAMASFDATVGALAPDSADVFNADADLNANGIEDLSELALIEQAVDGGASFAAAVTAAMETNITATEADFAGAATPFPTGVTVIAGYATLGGDDNWAVVAAVLGSGEAFGADTTPEREAYDESQNTNVGPCADPDSDGVKNVNEFFAGLGTEAAYRADAFAAGTAATAYDNYGSCGNFGFLKAHFYDAATDSVYGYDATALTFEAARDGLSVTIAGIPVEGYSLAEPRTALLNEGLLSIAPDDGWIGASDATVEDEWRWLSDNAQFWQGKAAGATVGGLYANWNDGEPNGNTEDFAEMRDDGTWNDLGGGTQGFFYKLDGTFADADTDGIPDSFFDEDLNGVPDGFGDAVVVTVDGGGDPELFVGGTLQLEALSDVGDTHTYTSDDTGVATVNNSGLVTGTGAGTVTITVAVASGTGLGNYVSGNIDLTVTVPDWFEVCDIDDDFAAQFDQLSGFGFDDDNELGVGDGVPDAWQLHLLAWAICEDSAKSLDDVSEATAAYEANLALMPAAVADLTANYVPHLQGLGSALADIVALQAKFDTGGASAACDGALAGLGIPSIAGVLQDVLDSAGDIGLLGLADVLVAANGQALAGMGTTSTELGLTLNAGLDELLRDTPNQIFQLLGVIVLPAMFGGLGGACPGSPETEASAILTAAGFNAVFPGDLPAITGGSAIAPLAWPAWVALQDSAKTAGEPLAGAGDFDGDGLTNAAVAAIISGQGGDEDDFVVAASGGFGPFWEGNPALPVGGMVGLGALFSALGAAGAVVLRRKK
ncbi:MAG: Ig-like domain-containing protein [Candidatus Hydrogenedentes bacterium]|nr:Ig-like domain-containing protein [Candidatus Hydrogenedentota bacterium]